LGAIFADVFGSLWITDTSLAVASAVLCNILGIFAGGSCVTATVGIARGGIGTSADPLSEKLRKQRGIAVTCFALCVCVA
jgi:hypothetical protein